ncbi:MAG: M3 family oligoendopeptidase [Nanoarchaeota archaeon]|nr:M3 family oligoendopeptidase [Nanoarchaeota archaeon]
MQEIKIGKKEWNLDLFFKGGEKDVEKDKERVKKRSDEFVKKWKNRDEYLKNPKVLKDALDDYNDLIENYGNSGNAGYYFYLRNFQDQIDPKIKAENNKMEEFGRKIDNEIQFFSHRISKIPEKEQKKFLDYSGLKTYSHWLEKSFKNAKYLLSEDEEKIMNLMSSSAYSKWVDMVSSFLAKEEKEILNKEGKKDKKSFSEILNMMSDQNKKVRDDAGSAFNEILAKNADSAEAEINAILSTKKTEDELRKMPRPDFSRHLGDDIDSEIVDVLINTVSSKFNIAKRFYALKAKLLGMDKLEYHERNVPYGKIEKKYTYEESVLLVDKVFNNLDKEFGLIFKDFVESGKIDVYPKKGKMSGAFCCHNIKSQPTYLMLNHTDRFEDVRIIAHEVGHGINNELMRKNQNALNFGTPLSTAEVASTFMEDFVLRELEKDSNDELKLVIMMNALNNDISTIFRQTACYKFEKDLHSRFREKGYLSKEEIGKIFQKNMASYMGDAVEQSSGSENWWVYWNHIRNFFYVYSYSSGLLISKAMQRAVRQDKKFIIKVKEFLSSGKSSSPKDIFLKMGINIGNRKFWEEGLAEVEDLLNEAEKLAKKLGKV